jgi:hypothetical protein
LEFRRRKSDVEGTWGAEAKRRTVADTCTCDQEGWKAFRVSHGWKPRKGCPHAAGWFCATEGGKEIELVERRQTQPKQSQAFVTQFPPAIICGHPATAPLCMDE